MIVGVGIVGEVALLEKGPRRTHVRPLIGLIVRKTKNVEPSEEGGDEQNCTDS
jgi:hypothetical protein